MVVRSFVIGLSVRCSSTSTSAVIVVARGARARGTASGVSRNTLPGPGEVLGDDRVQQPGGDAALHDDPAEPDARASSSS